VHELVTIDTDFIDARFNYETYRMKFMNRHRMMWPWTILRYCPCK